MSDAEKTKVGDLLSSKNADGSVTLRLQYPVEYGTETITELTMRRPLGAGMRAAKDKEGNIDSMILAAKSAGVADPLVDRMDMADVGRMLEVVSSFLLSGPPTGG